MSGGQNGDPAHSHDLLAVYERSAAFTRRLLEENQRLQLRIADAEARQRISVDDPVPAARLRDQLLACIDSMQRSKAGALERQHETESGSRELAKRYREIETGNNNLIHLYVALDRLYATLDLSQVLRTIVQIAVNLIGAEVLAIYALDQKSGQLSPVAAEGERLDTFPSFALGEGIVGSAVATGRTIIHEAQGAGDPARPVACIPLRSAEHSIGAIAILRLLRQTQDFNPLDHELFTLLAEHAATAISSARAYAQSKRKLSTMRGFIDLLTA